ncbi:MAG: N(4)-(beta-N-acetylglucosaminyl)-L-asparaginase [Rhodospirillaceae bacterium]|jgi:L-asparaginase / beta-aspartyl-peptidase|nr:N(4)-(beta-N-acetylglucosaminyl)-L-asparaginase [Rhodospirillaceae bacterium]MBT4490143.1 N(4)-(beta-N-acetylglucosaminyl)-L-asparaginase [Rhodospirillaceae bacterium]MBT5192803.1 N(4)-(beta-N-acetylglucosaminyl)-L-asparaginase [Rhodospirillaceae bacterium]MBT5894326.1 N(4)-(beta-N-acetylglucosaminyl)-L-asparaginase [Rhodospirillaceae bacterium]MBT6430229.1 N(4)-(beta-N-acetylglucosaminyl)-L-asparaginase [Rhodospirillaceae bacterium]
MTQILVTNSEGRPGVGKTAEMLAAGHGGLDAIEAGIRLVEADTSIRTVGRGGWPNLLGEVELDAAIIDGNTFRSGAVGALKGYLHPISIARAVLERLPHEMLVGEGAARFAHETGAQTADNLIPDSERVWRQWFEEKVSPDDQRKWPNVPLAELCQQAIDPEKGMDTTVFLSLDGRKEIMAGVSTSGWAWKYPGRLGDSPIIGAGCFADSEHGAAACTGAGEMAIRAGTSRAIVLYMKMGLSLEAAVDEAIADLRRLKGGLIQRITLHAIDRDGRHRVVAVNAEEQLTYWLWQEGEAEPHAEPAEIIAL